MEDADRDEVEDADRDEVDKVSDSEAVDDGTHAKKKITDGRERKKKDH